MEPPLHLTDKKIAKLIYHRYLIGQSIEDIEEAILCLTPWHYDVVTINYIIDEMNTLNEI